MLCCMRQDSEMSKTAPSTKSSTQTKTTATKIPTPITKSTSRIGLLPTLTPLRYSIDADVIKCPLCVDVFKSPRVLPCGHSACFTCLESLILYTDSSKTKEFFLCPICRRKTKPADDKLLRQRWAAQFPVNSVILRLLRNASLKNPVDNSSYKAFCEICLANNKTRPVVAQCKTCLEHYCDICYKHHERREDARDHEMVYYVPKEEIERAEIKRNEQLKQMSTVDASSQQDKAKSKDPRKAKDIDVVVAQTVTASDVTREKHVIKLGGFSGKALGDTATSDFRGGAFLTDGKVVLSDFANKKIKVFDVTHKTRIELICDMTLRVDPTQVCRVDANTAAVLTERSGNYHIRLFTIREKILHFVHRSLDTVPLGLGYLRNTVVCSFLGNNVLNKYRLTRAQQIKMGVIKHDMAGNDLFHHPGVICQGEVQGMPALFVADETEFGVTVTSITLNGEKRHSVFLEVIVERPKVPSGKRSSGTSRTGRLGRIKSSRSLIRRDDGSESTGTTGESEVEKGRKRSANKPPTMPRSREPTRDVLSGRHTFRRVDEYGRAMPTERKSTKEIERPNMGDSKELSIDLAKLTDEVLESADRSSRGKHGTREGNKAVERARRRPEKPVGKVAPQPSKENSISDHASAAPSSAGSQKPNVANSTIGTVGFLSSTPKLVYRADSIAVDKDGNIYVCMSSANKVVRLSADGRNKSDVLTEKDGLLAPKIISFSPSNDMFFVTCMRSNRVMMFRMK